MRPSNRVPSCPRWHLSWLLAVLFVCSTASAQQLTPEQIEAVRRGAASMQIPATGTVVPLLGPPHLPLVEVRLDGRGPYRFLVDLGSNVVVVRRAVADEAGLEIVVDRERSDLVAARSLTLGEVEFSDVWMAAYDDLDVDGVIGYNILRGTGVVLDYPGRTFHLGPLRLPAPAGTRDGVLSYEVHNRLPYIPARVGERDILLNLDTGATNHIVFPLFMADSVPLAASPAPGPMLYNNQTGSVRSYVARLKADIVFGGFVIERPVVLFDPAVEDMWLGSAILANSRLELDTERQVLRLVAADPLVSPAYRTLGLSLGPVDARSGQRPITDVIPDSPAARLGISTGDMVVSIEGVPAGELDPSERRRLAAEHDAVTIILRRGDEDENLRLDVATLPEALLDGATVEAVERMLMDKMAEERIPGLSAAIVVDGRLAWSGAYGTADLENDVPARATTAYRTASIGKTMTATAVMQLVEQGRVDLDAPVQRYCPAFPEKRWTVTTRHLLGHTSGIRHYGGPNEQAELFNTVHYDDVIQSLDIFKNDPLLFEPGTAHQYSTFGYSVLGCVVAGASGQSFRSYMQEHVFAPAGMVDTRDDDPAAIIPRRAAGYVLAADGQPQNSRAVDMSSKLPGGGFITTAEDLARFAMSVMSHRLVQAETLEQMITPARLRGGEAVDNGLGWGVFPGEEWYGEREAFHGGVTPQVSGMLYLLPDRRFAVAILTNLESVPGRTQLSANIAKVVLSLD